MERRKITVPLTAPIIDTVVTVVIILVATATARFQITSQKYNNITKDPFVRNTEICIEIHANVYYKL